MPEPVLEEQIELNFSIKNFPVVNVISSNDPFIVIYIKDPTNVYYKRISTDIIWDTSNNIDFIQEIEISFKFEEIQTITCEIYGTDKKELKDLSKHVYIGYCEFIVGDLVTSEAQKLELPIKTKKGELFPGINNLQPTMIVKTYICEIIENYCEFELQLQGNKLPCKSWFRSINPYFQVYRKERNDDWFVHDI